MALNGNHRRAGLAVPAAELREIAAVGIGHGGAEIVARDGLTIVALEVQVHALTEAVAAKQGLVHAHDFCAFLVHRDGVEVVDLFVAVGAHRVGHGACVFRELRLAQRAHVFDALDGARAGSGGFRICL